MLGQKNKWNLAICWTMFSISWWFRNVKCSSDELKKKTAHVAPMEKAMKKKNISCITMISISRRFPISIHAPTWGTTPLTRLIMSSAPFFQSTHPCGVRQSTFAPLVDSLVLMQFQISHWLSNLITGPCLKHEWSLYYYG